MKVENLIVKEEEFKGNKYLALYVIINNEEYLIGTIKNKDKFKYINCIHKEYKKN